MPKICHPPCWTAVLLDSLFSPCCPLSELLQAWIMAETIAPMNPGIKNLFKWGKEKTTPLLLIFLPSVDAWAEAKNPTTKPTIRGAQGL